MISLKDILKIENIFYEKKDGWEWYYVVEQGNGVSKFWMKNIHNTKNVVYIPWGTSGSLHSKISGYYSSIDISISEIKKVRNIVKTWSFDEQYEFGLKILKQFGGEQYIR